MMGIVMLVLACILLVLMPSAEVDAFTPPSTPPPLPPAYVISLPHRHDRRQSIAERVGSGGTCRFVDAIDGARLPPHVTDRSALTKGEVGCFLSHVKALELVEQHPSGHDAILVLEDDADADFEKVAKAIPRLVAEAPRGWGAIALGCNAFPSEPAHAQRVSSHLWKFQGGFDLYGAHAIVYSRSGAAAFAKSAREACEANGVTVPWDLWLGRCTASSLYVARPALVTPQNLHDSDTQRIR